MTITSSTTCQFANQAIQYCAAKVVAEHTGQTYQSPPCFRAKNGHPVAWRGEPALRMEPTEGRATDGTVQECDGVTIDLDSLDRDRPIKITGYCQSYPLLQPYKHNIRNWWLKLRVPLPTTDPEAVYVHVRRLDYVPGVSNPNRPNEHCVAATLAEYARCLEYFPGAKQLVVCTDDPRDPWLQELNKLGLPWCLHAGTWDQDFLLLAAARWLIMPQSTYSWLAGFLGDCERIVCPVFSGSHWHYGLTDPGYPDMYVFDEPDRWIWLTDKGPWLCQP